MIGSDRIVVVDMDFLLSKTVQLRTKLRAADKNISNFAELSKSRNIPIYQDKIGTSILYNNDFGISTHY